MLGLSACAELGIQFPDFRGPATETARPAAEEQALSNAGRFPEDITEEVAKLKPPPPLPIRKPEVPPAAIEAAKVPEVEPDSLVGLDFERTTALLGEPALLIEEPPAKIWAYNGASCVLHVFFYPKVGGTDFRVLTYEVKGGAEGDASSDADPKDFARLCLSELLVQAEASRGGEDASPIQPANGTADGS
ncbi:hypothetical protein AAFN88_20100 [Pelagibius sp. CAU 1746]|uniref:hypothetical protein n=1 Tax=Pelagibius sp. CAU 1746 TaxID=3140370 RepID=UPI00325A97A1